MFLTKTHSSFGLGIYFVIRHSYFWFSLFDFRIFPSAGSLLALRSFPLEAPPLPPYLKPPSFRRR